FGWGRLNAARIFAPAPVTTRVRTQPFELHTLPNTTAPDIAPFDFLFTTLNPVAWSVSAPPWLIPAATLGSGSANLLLSLDANGLNPGSYQGRVAVSAPTASDAGGGVDVALQVHRDQRTGSQIIVDPMNYPRGGAPHVATDGQGAMVVWVAWYINP